MVQHGQDRPPPQEHPVQPYLETYVAGHATVDWDADNGQHALLQYACEMGRASVVRVLLERGAANTKPGPVIAASHGHHCVLRVFTERGSG